MSNAIDVGNLESGISLSEGFNTNKIYWFYIIESCDN